MFFKIHLTAIMVKEAVILTCSFIKSIEFALSKLSQQDFEKSFEVFEVMILNSQIAIVSLNFLTLQNEREDNKRSFEV
jgi:hypothetical protein